MKKKIIIVGAGPGGLAAGMLLSHKGYEVTIFEKQPFIGGRTSGFQLNGYTFDLGPTFLMMKFILEEIFELSGRKLDDHLDIRRIDPLYRLSFADGTDFFPSSDEEAMQKEINAKFPGEWKGYLKFIQKEKRKYDYLVPCLKVPYSSVKDFFTKHFLRSIPHLDAMSSLYNVLGRYFSDPRMKLSFTFQSKYLGMSPWQCPGTFSMIPYIEHAAGIYHPIGGLNQITKTMAKIIEEEGGKIHTDCPVKEIILENRQAKGVILKNGEKYEADEVIINADFAHAMDNLIPAAQRRKYSSLKLQKKKFSCSTFMLYLGLDRQYDLPHHTILFAEDYKRNIDEIAVTYRLSEDPSIYVQNARATDPTLAPNGKSTLYILVPVPNNLSGISWEEVSDRYQEKALDIVEKRGGFTDLRKHIEVKRVVTPQEWENDMAIYRGATFNLAHNTMQMLYWRPHNQFEEFRNCYLVGGGTHPGSGLPTIFESARISARMILERDGAFL